ncbi:MAG: YraN family protein [Thermodesulfobacteriota bacterium]
MPGHDGGGPLGAQGELVATDTLRRQGYRILERNYRCPLGELDVVARKGKTLVFVEVKSGLDERILPRDRVDARKKRKLSQVAMFYLKEHGLEGVSARFDVVEVSFPVDGGTPRVELIPNAFDLDGT